MPRPAAAWLLGVCGAPAHGFPEEATRGPIRPSSDWEGQSKAQSPSPPPAHIVPDITSLSLVDGICAAANP